MDITNIKDSEKRVKQKKILYVTSHCPCAETYGGQIRSYNIANILKRYGDVSLALVLNKKIKQENLERANELFNLKRVIMLEPFRIRMWDRLKKEWDPKAFIIRNQKISKENRKAFFQTCEEYDLIWFHTVRIPDAFRIYNWKKSILDVDDLQSQIYKGQSKIASTITRKILDERMMWTWRRRERLFLKRFDVLCVCSENDRVLFGDDKRIYVVRNGYSVDGISFKQYKININKPRLGFIGKLDYEPNRSGIVWFLGKVWPKIKKEIPNVKLRLVGKGTDGSICSYGKDIDGLGWVSDTSGEIASWSAMIVPIQVGGGTRIKIAEGFARRCPIISTSVGAYGYGLKSGKEAILADSPLAFARACIDVIKDPMLRERLTGSAFQKYIHYWTWEAQASAVEKAVRHCLNRQTT
ncbi:MAG: glycosyltransferase family 4 protein [Desulfobacterales bacterium]|nr:glycosyltransferase family 4 protein [Desulfobacterales bacterium]